MKKALSLLLAVVMVMSLVACGGNNTANNTGKEETGKTETPGSDFGDKSQGVVIGGDKTEDKNSEVKAEYASEITLAGWGSIATLDPGEAWNASREAYQRLVYDTLLYHDDTTGEITMQLAKSVEWDNDDCTRVHVVLRDDIVFSNGEKLTAADVEFSIGRNTYSSVTSFYDSCEIVNDYELYINLKKPTASFINCARGDLIVEEDLIRALREAQEHKGPSVVVAYTPCVAHGIKAGMANVQSEMKRAVDAGYWTLYRYNPNAEKPMTVDSKKPTMDYEEFLDGEVRYASLRRTFPENAETLFRAAKADSGARYEKYKAMERL